MKIPKNFVPFEEHEPSMRLLNEGKALSVIMMFDDLEEPRQKKNYMGMLGFEKESNVMFCTILSEIGNMLGHYVVVGNHGKMVCGLHGDIFYVEVEDE